METTLDRLLDGQVQLHQPADGYRAGMDAVLLAAALRAKPGQTLVEFGCGVGAATLCAATRLGEGRFIGIEIDADAAALARENAELNALPERVEIVNGNMADAETGSADQVFFNPPYFDDPASLRTPKAGKQRAWLAGETPLADWVKAAARALRAKGRLTLIHRADKLGEILTALEKSFGSVMIKPVQPRAGQAAKRVIVSAVIGGKAPLVLLGPLVLHEGEGHSAEAEAIMRGRAGVDWGA